MVVRDVSNENCVDQGQWIFEALEAPTRGFRDSQNHGDGVGTAAALFDSNRKSGDYDTFRRWKVFAR